MIGNKRTHSEENETINYSETKVIKTESNSITFKVCNVKEEIFETILKRKWDDTSVNRSFKFETFIKKEIQSKQNKEYLDDDSDMDYSERRAMKKDLDEQATKESENCKVLKSSYENMTDQVNIGSNSFVYSAWNAYSSHHHLVIRPDNIWLSIMTQFSFYVNANSKELKSKLVVHDGKKELVVTTKFPILEAPFNELVVEMCDQIQLNIKDPSIREWVIPSFTTTTVSDKVVFSSVLMSTMQKYFEYVMDSECGLPKVTLQGELSNWINLKERVARLIEFENKNKEIGKWLNLLIPVIDKFIESVNGNPDTEWWNRIIHHESESGCDTISGWITAFCVFNNDGHYQANLRTNQVYPEIDTDCIPNGYVSTPITLIDSDSTRYNSTLFSGHISVKVLSTKLSPSLDWLLVANINNK